MNTSKMGNEDRRIPGHFMGNASVFLLEDQKARLLSDSALFSLAADQYVQYDWGGLGSYY